ncbi:Sigma-70 family RNA polymerase sigma factor [Gammaproteobacteria bacterium]
MAKKDTHVPPPIFPIEFFIQKHWLAKCRRKAWRFFEFTTLDPKQAAQDTQGDLYKKLLSCKKPLTEPLVRKMFKTTMLDIYRNQHDRHTVQRPRPPKWVKDLGPFWVWLWKMACLNLRWLPRYEMVRILNEPLKPPFHNQVDCPWDEWVEQGIQILNQNEACPEEVTLVPADTTGANAEAENAEGWVELPDTSTFTADDLATADLRTMLKVLVGFEDPVALSACIQRTIELGQILSKDLALNDKERILLKLLFQEGLPVDKVARQLGQPPHQINYKRTQVLERIRKVLKDHDIDFQDFLNSLSQ